MDRKTLIQQIQKKKSFLCVGLDTELSKIPDFFKDYEDPIFEFNKAIIDATKDYCVAYKPNIAFYESAGIKGWQALQKTLDYIPKDIFTIADAKRGDIGNTSRLYAQTFFQTYNFDSVTVAPYMGSDSVKPFLEFQGKWVILLGLTSNPGAMDFQFQHVVDHHFVYHKVIEKAREWGSAENLMFVIGATHPEKFAEIRRIAPDNFYLVPGIGAQGGDLEGVCKFGFNHDIGLLVNSSRGILYASKGTDFAERAAKEASVLQKQMEKLM